MPIQTVEANQPTETRQRRGRWVTQRKYSEHFDRPMQTLVNWRFLDRKAGRSEALPGYPRYKVEGRSVRYWIPAEEE